MQRKLYKAKAQRAVSGRQLAVYSRGGFAEEGRQRRRREEEEEGRKDERKLRNLTTPHRSGGEKDIHCLNYTLASVNQLGTRVALSWS